MATLRRGYAIVRREDGVLVKSIRQVDVGDLLEILVSDGEFEATAQGDGGSNER